MAIGEPCAAAKIGGTEMFNLKLSLLTVTVAVRFMDRQVRATPQQRVINFRQRRCVNESNNLTGNATW